ncbi:MULTISPECIES: hypothetical protein [unclassified Carboxylicivirga]|uniref:beta-propeller domain-containing protein n=1 Tax=Carboxylicivirga TaxID=1628153 RepID=UPI003D32A53E
MMKNGIILLVITIALMACETQKTGMLMAGSGWKKIVKTDKQGNILWHHLLEKGQECNEVTELENGNILYAHRSGAKVITPGHEVVWQYTAPEGTELQSASLTEDGNYLLGQCGCPAQIMEFTPEGEKIKEVIFDTGIQNPHSQFRRIRKTNQNTYIVPVLKTGEIHELNENGKILKTINVGKAPFSVVILENDNWLVSLGDAHRLIEINPLTNEILWEVKENDIAGVPLRFVAEAIRLDNGNTIICNWSGHAKGDQPTASVVEIKRNAQVVWKLKDNEHLGLISTISPDWGIQFKR